MRDSQPVPTQPDVSRAGILHAENLITAISSALQSDEPAHRSNSLFDARYPDLLDQIRQTLHILSERRGSLIDGWEDPEFVASLPQLLAIFRAMNGLHSLETRVLDLFDLLMDRLHPLDK